MDFKSLINPLYAYDAVKDQMKVSFKSSKPSVLLLPDFFTKKVYDSLTKEAQSLEAKEKYIPHMYRYHEVPSSAFKDIFSSDFLTFVREITGIKSKKLSLDSKRFGHRCFTLLHDDLSADGGLIFFYTIASSKWNSSSGGQTIFTFGDEREPLIFDVKENSLVLLHVPKGMRSFVKYLNHFSGTNGMLKVEGIFS